MWQPNFWIFFYCWCSCYNFFFSLPLFLNHVFHFFPKFWIFQTCLKIATLRTKFFSIYFYNLYTTSFSKLFDKICALFCYFGQSVELFIGLLIRFIHFFIKTRHIFIFFFFFSPFIKMKFMFSEFSWQFVSVKFINLMNMNWQFLLTWNGFFKLICVPEVPKRRRRSSPSSLRQNEMCSLIYCCWYDANPDFKTLRHTHSHSHMTWPKCEHKNP